MSAPDPRPPYGIPADLHDPAALGPVAPDLARATAWVLPDAATVLAAGQGVRMEPGFYQRMSHPAALQFEAHAAKRDGAEGAVSFASGMAAISGALFAHVKQGDRVLVADQIYGGTEGFVTHDLLRFGVQVDRFDALDPNSLIAALSRPAHWVVFESPINPTLRLVDVARLAEIAFAHNAKSLFDSTFAPKPIQRPLDLGVDLVVHSATKFYGGHGDVLAGVVVGAHELLEPVVAFRDRTGAMLAPDPAWLLLRSMPTLDLRLKSQQAGAFRIAEELASRVASDRGAAGLLNVTYPGLASHPDREIFQRQMNGGGALVAIEVAHGLEGAVAVFDQLRCFARAPSLGGVECVASIPAYTTHAHLTANQRRIAGIPDGLLRLAVGVRRYCQWRILTCILMAIFMPSHPPIA